MKASKLPKNSLCPPFALVFPAIMASLFSLPETNHAQPPPFRWVAQAGGAFDDFSRGIAVDAAGNSYVTGAFHDVAGFGDKSESCSRGQFEGGYGIHDACGQEVVSFEANDGDLSRLRVAMDRVWAGECGRDSELPGRRHDRRFEATTFDETGTPGTPEASE